MGKCMMRKRELIINKVKRRMICKPDKMKFGIRVPINSNKAKYINDDNDDTRCQRSIKQEMISSRVAFQ